MKIAYKLLTAELEITRTPVAPMVEMAGG